MTWTLFAKRSCHDTDEEAIAVDEVAAGGDDQAVINVPLALLPEIRRLLAPHRNARQIGD